VSSVLARRRRRLRGASRRPADRSIIFSSLFADRIRVRREICVSNFRHCSSISQKTLQLLRVRLPVVYSRPSSRRISGSAKFLPPPKIRRKNSAAVNAAEFVKFGQPPKNAANLRLSCFVDNKYNLLFWVYGTFVALYPNVKRWRSSWYLRLQTAVETVQCDCLHFCCIKYVVFLQYCNWISNFNRLSAENYNVNRKLPKIEIRDKIRLIWISAVFLVQPDLFFKNSARKSTLCLKKQKSSIE